MQRLNAQGVVPKKQAFGIKSRSSSQHAAALSALSANGAAAPSHEAAAVPKPMAPSRPAPSSPPKKGPVAPAAPPLPSPAPGGEVCSEYRLDMAAATFGACVCGFPKSLHCSATLRAAAAAPASSNPAPGFDATQASTARAAILAKMASVA